MTRRKLLVTSASGALALAAADYVPKRKYRAAVIGHTGQGNYGHDWHTAWHGIANVEVTALADANEAGRQKAIQQVGRAGVKGYADYREMIAREKPDIVNICPRTLDERLAMVTAAAEAGAHILMEKPFARNLREADAIEALVNKHKIKLQLGHSARGMSVTAGARDLLRNGKLGVLEEIRARGKEDRRAGGEDLIVLGTHCFDLMRYFTGANPEWVFAHATEKGRELTSAMMHPAGEAVGQIGGDNISAMFGFPNGVHAYFGSQKNDVLTGSRFGVSLNGSRGFVFVPLNAVPSDEPYHLDSPAWVPEKGEPWVRIPYAEGKPSDRHFANKVMALDLLEAIETGREPVCSAQDGRWTIEMVAGIYASHFSGARTRFPLSKRA